MQKETVDVLKNFASINQGILILEGSELRTMSIMKNVFATAKVPDTFDREFAVYDLNEFLATLSLFDKPELAFKEEHILIAEGKSKIKYFYSAPSVIVSPPRDKSIKVEGDLTFQLPLAILSQLLKAASVMSLKELEITSKGLRAFNKSSVGNQYDVKLEDITGETSPKILNIENLKLLPRDYTVVVGNKAVKFTSIDKDLEYIVAVEAE